MRTVAGFSLLAVGCVLALPGIPGPGILIMVLGLAILSRDFAWARKLLASAKARLHQIRARSAAGQPVASPQAERRP